MRAAEDIRRYLYGRGCHILEDRLVLDAGRIYQVFMAGPPSGILEPLPAGWPVDYHTFGYTAFARRDPLLGLAVKKRLAQLEQRVQKEHAEALDCELEKLRRIADCLEEPI
jgi:tRNA A22 N-methylase